MAQMKLQSGRIQVFVIVQGEAGNECCYEVVITSDKNLDVYLAYKSKMDSEPAPIFICALEETAAKTKFLFSIRR
jgi:hypothetical protein